MKIKLISFLFTTLIISCNLGNKKTNTDHKVEVIETTLSNEMPTNHINAWMDDCGFSFEFNGDTIWALGEHKIRYERLNDSLFEIFYPEKPMIIKDVRIENYEGSRYISFSNSGLGCCLHKTKNEIQFGADRLSFQKISDNSIKVFFPHKSFWKISRVSEREIYIYYEKNKIKYTEFKD